MRPLSTVRTSHSCVPPPTQIVFVPPAACVLPPGGWDFGGVGWNFPGSSWNWNGGPGPVGGANMFDFDAIPTIIHELGHGMVLAHARVSGAHARVSVGPCSGEWFT